MSSKTGRSDLPNERHAASEQELIWLRADRARRGPQPTLNREQITRAAIELADGEGLEAVSMRRIAAKLAVGATSLYWHVLSKDDLYELMVDEVIGEIQLPERSDDWRADLRAIAEHTHAVLRRHRWLVLLGIQPGLGPKTQRYGQAALAALEDLGLDLATQINILAALNNYLFGFIHREIAWEHLRQRSTLTDKQWTARLRRYLEQTSEEDETLADHAAVRLDLATDESFDFGLDCILDGVAARLRARSR
jgi:AcrR family transcriptional regulator